MSNLSTGNHPAPIIYMQYGRLGGRVFRGGRACLEKKGYPWSVGKTLYELSLSNNVKEIEIIKLATNH